MIDELLDEDPFDLDRPGEVVLAAGSGVFDDDAPCACWCECGRRVEWPDDTCAGCEAGRHRDPFETADGPGR